MHHVMRKIFVDERQIFGTKPRELGGIQHLSNGNFRSWRKPCPEVAVSYTRATFDA